MKNRISYVFFLLASSLLISGCTGSKKTATPNKSSSSSSRIASKDGLKPFDKVINKSATVDEGVFTVSEQDGTYFFEITNNLLNREMLMVSRIPGVPPGFPGFSSAGSKSCEQVVTISARNRQDLIANTIFCQHR